VSEIVISELHKVYGDQIAVERLNLAVGAGELMVLVGPSGCGKTTTLRMLAGFVQPTSGRIAIGGRDVTRLPPRERNIGMVFQDYALFPGMTVRQNIAFGLEEHGASRDTVRRRVGEMLELIRMAPLADRLPKDLSGGQQQRVALARALAYQPSVLLMDEPLGALDQQLRENMQREIVAVQKQLGITTIFVTHDQQEAMVLADRILVMKDGCIEQLGSPEELYGAPTSLFTASFIGRSNLLRGTLCESHGANAQVQLRSGERITARMNGQGAAPGQDVVCMVRPERMRVAQTGEDPAGLNRLGATLQRHLFLGSVVEVAGTTSQGESVTLHVDPERAGDLSVPRQAEIVFAPDCTFAFRAQP